MRLADGYELDPAVPLGDLRPHPKNPNQGDVGAIVESIETVGFYGTVTAQKPRNGRKHGRILAGEHRWRAAQAENADTIPVSWLDVDDETALRILLADNQIARLALLDQAAQAAALESLVSSERGLAGTGSDADDLDQILSDLAERDGHPSSEPIPIRRLSDRFVAPPFSVLDARQGYWQARKREWLGLGIESELGRPNNLLKMSGSVLGAMAPNKSTPASASGNDPAYYWKKTKAEAEAGRPLSNAEFEAEWWEPYAIGGTSIFDPVLCEIAYRWWSAPGASILDPFAGGSVRGLVASILGRAYTGIDISATQIAANEEQATTVLTDQERPRWVLGDSTAPPPEADGPFDMILSCPPYHDLERYSDDPADLSNMEWPDFLSAYRRSIQLAVDRLADDRFAVWVIGEVRAPDGVNRGLVPATIQAFTDAGMDFYNDAVLITASGSLALRAARIFAPQRKLARSHQAVLVFVKGSPAKAAEACGEVDGMDLTISEVE